MPEPFANDAFVPLSTEGEAVHTAPDPTDPQTPQTSHDWVVGRFIRWNDSMRKQKSWNIRFGVPQATRSVSTNCGDH